MVIFVALIITYYQTIELHVTTDLPRVLATKYQQRGQLFHLENELHDAQRLGGLFPYR